MEFTNGYYSMNPDKYIAEIKDLKENQKDYGLSDDEMMQEVTDIRSEFYKACYERAEYFGYIHRVWHADQFMPKFDEAIGLKEVPNKFGGGRHFEFVA